MRGFCHTRRNRHARFVAVLVRCSLDGGSLLVFSDYVVIYGPIIDELIFKTCVFVAGQMLYTK